VIIEIISTLPSNSKLAQIFFANSETYLELLRNSVRNDKDHFFALSRGSRLILSCKACFEEMMVLISILFPFTDGMEVFPVR